MSSEPMGIPLPDPEMRSPDSDGNAAAQEGEYSREKEVAGAQGGEPGESVLPMPASSVRFCRSCGRAWEPTWEACPACSQRELAASAKRGESEARFYEETGRIKSAILLYTMLLAVSAVVMLIAGASDGENTVMVDIVASTIFSGIVVLWCVISWRALVPRLKRIANPLWYVVAAAGGCFTFVAAMAAVSGLTAIFDLPEYRYTDAFLFEGYGFEWVVLLIAVQPAIFEELAFRGVIEGSLEHVIRPVEALFVTAFMFAILHLSIPAMPHLMLIGIALGWLRMKTGSLYPGMILHFVHNFLVVLDERYGSFLPW